VCHSLKASLVGEPFAVCSQVAACDRPRSGEISHAEQEATLLHAHIFSLQIVEAWEVECRMVNLEEGDSRVAVGQPRSIVLGRENGGSLSVDSALCSGWTWCVIATMQWPLLITHVKDLSIQE
jgi:hypothetical protein